MHWRTITKNLETKTKKKKSKKRRRKLKLQKSEEKKERKKEGGLKMKQILNVHDVKPLPIT